MSSAGAVIRFLLSLLILRPGASVRGHPWSVMPVSVIGINIQTPECKLHYTSFNFGGIMAVRILNNIRALVPVYYLLGDQEKI